ncbi:MAG: alpha-L-rhamnosidase N-terminal domain-containing protein [Pseudomonadales bacterium]
MAGAPKRLRCEYLHNPLGIDALRPVLTWLVNDQRPAEIQTGWQVLAASEPGRLTEARADLWNSGRVSSSGAVPILYGGAGLISRQRVWWTVRTFDSDGLPAAFAPPAFFEMGLLEPGDWSGVWIGAGYQGSRSLAAPAPLLIRDFSINSMPRRARLYIAAGGHVQAHINGQNVGLGADAPTASDYRHRVRYRSVDVTGLLTLGINRLGTLLLDGAYAGNVTRGHQRQQYGERPLLLAQLELLTADGRLQRFTTDEQWRWAPSGWLTSDRILGEHFDARGHPSHWARSPGTPELGSQWQPVATFAAPAGQLSADTAPTMLRQHKLQPVGQPLVVVDEWNSLALQYQFAEPVFGRVSVDAAVPPGGRLTLTYGLPFEPDSPAVDSVTATGALTQHQGVGVLRRFQSVTVAGDVSQTQPPAVVAHRFAPQQSATLQFETDCGVLQLLQKQLHSDLYAGCAAQPLTGVDLERGLPATGQLTSVLEVLGRSADSAALLRCWALDLMDAETRRSDLPRVVPAVLGEPLLRGSGSTEALVQVVWNLYCHHGDIATLQLAYGPIVRLLAVLTESAQDLIRWTAGAPDPQVPGDLVGTAWFYRTASIAAAMAAALGREQEQRRHEALAQQIRQAFRHRFVTADGTIVSRTQTAACLALVLDLLDPHERPQCVAGLVTSVQREGLLVQVGLLGTLLCQLCEQGHDAVAFKLMTDPASTEALLRRYGRTMVTAGALDWLYGGLLGIRQQALAAPADVAYRRLRIAPSLPGGPAYEGLSSLRSAAGRCLTARGEIAVQWHLAEQHLQLRIVLPADTSAELVLPGREPVQLAAGSHEFQLDSMQQSQQSIPQLQLDAQTSGYPRAS